jgi:hypothetical protein
MNHECLYKGMRGLGRKSVKIKNRVKKGVTSPDALRSVVNDGMVRTYPTVLLYHNTKRERF